MKTVFISMLMILYGLTSLFASEPLVVDKLIHRTTDLSASNAPKDMNGNPCGLLKVITNDKSMTFEGSVIGTPEYKNGEYWVYLPEGTYQVRIKASDKEPVQLNLRDYNISQVIAKSTYELSFKQQQDASYIYLNNAYSALNAGQINSARNHYQRFKEISGNSDSLFEVELSKADGTYIWSEEELKDKGFIIGCEDGHYGGFGYIDDTDKYNLTFSTIPGPDGTSAFIEKDYGHMKFIYGKIVNGYLNGLCLLSSNIELPSTEEYNTVFNHIYEIAYVKDGKVVTPTIGVFKSPIIIYNSTPDPYKEYRDMIFINEYGLRYYEYHLNEVDNDPMTDYLKQIYAPDILNNEFVENFRVGRIDMDYILNNFNKFMMSNTKIPSHVWNFK